MTSFFERGVLYVYSKLSNRAKRLRDVILDVVVEFEGVGAIVVGIGNFAHRRLPDGATLVTPVVRRIVPFLFVIFLLVFVMFKICMSSLFQLQK